MNLDMWGSGDSARIFSFIRSLIKCFKKWESCVMDNECPLKKKKREGENRSADIDEMIIHIFVNRC